MNQYHVREAHDAPRTQKAAMETVVVSADEIRRWQIPPFQRPLRITEKLKEIVAAMKRDGGTIEGIITLGRIRGEDSPPYIVDGQHRCQGALMSGLPEFMVDIRLCTFATMAEMADEFVKLNQIIVRMRPDDMLRGLEANLPTIATLRTECPFLGYSATRARGNHMTVSMAAVIRAWEASGANTPTAKVNSKGTGATASAMTEESIANLIRFLNAAKSAWGVDRPSVRLWASLNLTLCMWIYRKMVLEPIPGVRRYARIDDAAFTKCLMSAGASEEYSSWLVGRHLKERDRTPCYSRLRSLFIARLREEFGGSPKMPMPEWAPT